MGGDWMQPERLLAGSHHIYYLVKSATQSLPCNVWLAKSAGTNGQASTTECIDSLEEFQSAASHHIVELEADPPQFQLEIDHMDRS